MNARRRLIPTRLHNGCISFIPVATVPVMSTCVDNCVRDSIAFGNTDPDLLQQCRQCCQTCIENTTNTDSCIHGCAIGGSGGGGIPLRNITDIQRQIYYDTPLTLFRSVTYEPVQGGEQWEVATHYIFPPSIITLSSSVQNIVRSLYDRFFTLFVEGRAVYMGINHRQSVQDIGDGVVIPILTMIRRRSEINFSYRQCQTLGLNTETIAISMLAEAASPPVSSLILYHYEDVGMIVDAAGEGIVAGRLNTGIPPPPTSTHVQCVFGANADTLHGVITV